MATDRLTSLALTQHQLRLMRDAMLANALELAGMAHTARKAGNMVHAAVFGERQADARALIAKLDAAIELTRGS